MGQALGFLKSNAAARLRRLRRSRIVFLSTALATFVSLRIRSSPNACSSCDLCRAPSGIFKLRSSAICTSRSRTRPAFLRKRESNFRSFLRFCPGLSSSSVAALPLGGRWCGTGEPFSTPACRHFRQLAAQLSKKQPGFLSTCGHKGMIGSVRKTTRETWEMQTAQPAPPSSLTNSSQKGRNKQLILTLL